ncbi:hypothetical protein [Laceyella putida]|jgi:succinate dehydrogenase/fumarate reductase cytochrome b subunit|uniref:Uncharacterized protein n=1 Tax=Laceyella putida TaxID=110101 RepID=A0ABW2RH57_9BACL
MLITGIILLCVFLIIFAFFTTFRLGATQSQTTNEHYNRSRKKTIILLSIIYIIASVIGLLYVYLV